VGVGHGLGGPEALRDHQHQRPGRVATRQSPFKFNAIDVGDKMHGRPVGDRCQGLEHQARAQIGAADANVDDMLDGLTGGAGAALRPHRIGHLAHLPPGAGHRPGGGRARPTRGPVRHTQGSVQRGAALAGVDRRTGQHPITLPGDIPGLGEGQQRIACRPGEGLFAVVEQKPVEFDGKRLEALRVIIKQTGNGSRLDGCALIEQRLPGWRCRQCLHDTPFSPGAGRLTGMLSISRACPR